MGNPACMWAIYIHMYVRLDTTVCIMYCLDVYIIFRLWGHHGPGGIFHARLLLDPVYLWHSFVQEWTAPSMFAIKDSRDEQDMFMAGQLLLLVWQVNILCLNLRSAHTHTHKTKQNKTKKTKKKKKTQQIENKRGTVTLQWYLAD